MWHHYVCIGHWHNYFLKPQQGVQTQCSVYLYLMFMRKKLGSFSATEFITQSVLHPVLLCFLGPILLLYGIKARVFPAVSHFYSSLIFEGKARNLPVGGWTLACNYQTMIKVTDNDKHYNLEIITTVKSKLVEVRLQVHFL